MRTERLRIRHVAVVSVTALSLCLLISSCKKKVPPPPPPPPPKEAPVPPPPPPAKPRIESFTAEPGRIERGQSATLRWSVANATDIAIDQGLGAVPANGSRQVFPSNTTSYTLSAKGPGGEDSRSVSVEVSAPPPPPPPPPPAPKLSSAEILGRDAADAYFDFDKSDIRPDAREALTKDAEVLKGIFANDPNFTVVIEGNCDERGSAEYNLALGDRRAAAAKEFLVQLGVPADRLKTISYGKERPVCTESTEECWQRNRHDHLAPGQ